MMSTKEFSDVIVTLVVNGFHLSKVERLSKDSVIVHCYKYDKLGAIARYSILFSDEVTETNSCQLFIKAAGREQSKAILVSNHYSSPECDSYSKAKFFAFFGGLINTGLILVQNLPDILNELGLNKTPAGLAGKANDLHELYVKESLQFAMDSPARRYGSDRLFQKLPDGIVLGQNRLLIPIDSKSYSKGYSISSDDINRYAYYVKDFNQRYESFFGRVFAFLVVTGKILDTKESIEKRSKELYVECNVNISCIESKTLGDFVQMLIKEPTLRPSVDWRNVFVNPKVTLAHLKKEIARIKKDKIA